MVNCRDVVPRVPGFQYYHAGHLMWKRCDQPPASVDSFFAEAYYREQGDFKFYEKLPLDFVIKSYEKTFASDHYTSEYRQWLEGAVAFSERYWAGSFQTFNEDKVASE